MLLKKMVVFSMLSTQRTASEQGALGPTEDMTEVLHDIFRVGLRLSVQPGTSYERLELTLIGWLKEHIIIAAGSQLKEVELTSGTHCIVRFVKDGVAYGFHTKMLSKLYSSVPIIFFEYPDNISNFALRKSQRVETNIPARIMGLKKEHDVIVDSARIVDISETGCLLEVAFDELAEIETGKEFYLTFKLWDESFEVDCTVKNIRKKEGHYLLGTAFKDIPESNKEIIQDFQCMLDVCQRKVPL